MPKKTKKEKIIALYRRKIKLLREKKEPIKTLSKKIIHPPIEKNTEEIKEKTQTNQITSYFLSDFKKSLTLIIIILALEIILYFVTIIKFPNFLF